MELRETLKILGLSLKEERVLIALQAGVSSVLDIATHSKVSRPSVYDILKKLKKRGLATSKILSGKKSWGMIDERELGDVLYTLKKKLLSFTEGKEEVFGVTDGTVIVHRGDVAVKREIFEMFQSHKNERFFANSGTVDNLMEGWSNIFTEDEINETNRIIKKNSLITEAVFPYGWIEKHFKESGVEWAKDMEGRTASVSYVDAKYFNHGGQIFAFKDVMYLLALNDKMIIEIRHSDIQKMILLMYTFMKDFGETVDINKKLR
jgi:transposase